MLIKNVRLHVPTRLWSVIDQGWLEPFITLLTEAYTFRPQHCFGHKSVCHVIQFIVIGNGDNLLARVHNIYREVIIL